MCEGRLIEQVALLGLHRRVADHAGGSADEGVWLVTAVLEMLEYHDADEVPDVQRVSCRVDAYIGACRAFHKFLFSSGHNVVDHSSPLKFLYKILHRMI